MGYDALRVCYDIATVEEEQGVECTFRGQNLFCGLWSIAFQKISSFSLARAVLSRVDTAQG